MTFAEVGEIIKAISAVVTAASAVIGLFIAYKGLSKWQIENLGKKKSDIAEEVLAGFYQMRDMIPAIRSPASFEHEINKVKELIGAENGEKWQISYFVPILRLDERKEDIASLMSKRYRMNALFGNASASPFDDLHRVIQEIRIASNMLGRKPISAMCRFQRRRFRDSSSERGAWRWDATNSAISNGRRSSRIFPISRAACPVSMTAGF